MAQEISFHEENRIFEYEKEVLMGWKRKSGVGKDLTI